MSEMKSATFLIACGGTGGHLFPGIAVAQELRRRAHRPVLLVSEKKIDALALEAHPELERRVIPMIAKPNLLSLSMLRFLGRAWSTYRACAKLIREYQANAVLGMGGFTSLFPIKAGYRAKLPTFIHESNAIPGKANKRTAKYCSAVFLGLNECGRFFPGKTCHVVGTPVRESFHHPVDLAAARGQFGLSEDKTTILIMGGSQGALALNRAVAGMLPLLDPQRWQCLHLTGPQDFEEVKSFYSQSSIQHFVSPFCSQMERAYSLADLAISRSGASSLTELAFFAIPSILVPYPFAAEDHQTRNAEAFTKPGAAILLSQTNLTGEVLAKTLLDQLGTPTKRESYRRNLKHLVVDDAVVRICNLMEGQLRA